MDTIQSVIIGVVIAAFVIRMITFNIGQARYRPVNRYFEQLNVNEVAGVINRAWSFHVRNISVDTVLQTAIRAEVMGLLARLKSMNPPIEMRDQHQLFVDTAALTMATWEPGNEGQ